MKFTFTIAVVLLVMSCRHGANITSDKGVDEKEINKSSPSHEAISTSKIIVAGNKEVQQTNAEKDTLAKVNKIQQELNELKASTIRIIESNQSIPSMQVDSSTNNRFSERKNYYFGLACDDVEEAIELNHFSIKFNDHYSNSSKNTGNYDGATFCIGKLDDPYADHSIIVFSRSEGGHTSDEISLITINNQQKLIFRLPLSYFTGWDGHETTVESTVEGNTIIRKITERYGWSNMHPDSLSSQPRRLVTQQIKVNENGGMEVIHELIEKYNIDELYD